MKHAWLLYDEGNVPFHSAHVENHSAGANNRELLKTRY